MDTTLETNDLLAELMAFGDLKVWSVLVTILGDLASAEGQSLTGPVLSSLTQRMGIRPEAQRVALHRLRKDGWITAMKVGRVSHYALSPRARAETQAVHTRVFDADVERPDHCVMLAVDPKSDASPPEAFLPIAPHLYLTDQQISAYPDGLVTSVALKDLPEWARQAVMPPQISATYGALFEVLDRHTSAKNALYDAEKLVARLLTLHLWRRLVLSHTRRAANLMGPDWVGNACRRIVHGWLNELNRPSHRDLLSLTA